jgi:protein-tyrosine-phosphatase
MGALPGSVLFACTLNSVRSPMAEALLKLLHPKRIFVDSAGVRASEVHPLAVAAMAEIGIDLSRHRAKTFDALADASFDLIVTFAPEAHHRALELTRILACEVEYWPMFDPTIEEGSHAARLAAFQSLRDTLRERIIARFPVMPPAAQ